MRREGVDALRVVDESRGTSLFPASKINNFASCAAMLMFAHPLAVGRRWLLRKLIHTSKGDGVLMCILHVLILSGISVSYHPPLLSRIVPLTILDPHRLSLSFVCLYQFLDNLPKAIVSVSKTLALALPRRRTGTPFYIHISFC